MPTLWGVVSLRSVLFERSDGRGRAWRVLMLGLRVLALLLLGLSVAHIFHHWLSPFWRYLVASILFLFAIVWRGELHRRLPDPLAIPLRRLPSPWTFPTGSRRVAAAIVVMPFWAPVPTSLESALALEMERQGLELDTASVAQGEVPNRGLRAILGAQRVLLRAREPGAPWDVYLARVMFDHEARPTRVTGLFNLSETDAAEEADLARAGTWAVWRVEVSGRTQSVELADLSGETFPSGPGWGLMGRLQRRITNIQQTGQFRGVDRASLQFAPGAEARVVLQPGELSIEDHAAALRLELGREPDPRLAEAGYRLVQLPPARPGDLTTWAVDRLRAVSFIGSGGMQWLKGVAFWASAKAEDLRAEVVGISAEETIAEELGDVVERLPIAKQSTLADWPPEPIPPQLRPALPAEGKWVDLGRDPVGGNQEGGQGAMLLTFIRVDPKRSYNQVSITLWDPRRIELHILAGTEEPKSTLGRQGTGLIPRDPRVLRRLVGAFNGAFQAVHGAFGMMEHGVVQLPPKPYAATVATFDDGSVAFGTWPAEPTPIPQNMTGLRQNMTPLVAEGSPNPYGRHWWGGVPEGWKEEARTVRSGLCLTRERYLAYFYSPSVDPDRLAQAMVLARCQYGIHLDMNAGHAGFEFYRVAEEAQLPSLGRALDPAWEARGQVPGAESLSFLARLMVRKMPLMNFPRYIHQTPRDFFYLLHRELLPGPELRLPPPLRVEPFAPVDIARNEFPPYVVAGRVESAEDPGAAVVLLRFDARQLEATGTPGAEMLSANGESQPGALVLFHTPRGLQIASHESPPSEATPLLANATGPAFYCVDEARFLTILEPTRTARDDLVQQVLSALGCVATISAPRAALDLLAGASGSSGASVVQPALESEGARRSLVRRSRPIARELFPETPIVPQSVWGLPQARPAALLR